MKTAALVFVSAPFVGAVVALHVNVAALLAGAR